MADTKKEQAIRDFIEVLSRKDVDKAMAFFADDATWTNTKGTFDGDKCRRLFTVVDRLSMARQAAGGFIAKTAVNSIIGTMEKGLR